MHKRLGVLTVVLLVLTIPLAAADPEPGPSGTPQPAAGDTAPPTSQPLKEIPENTWVKAVQAKDGPWKRNYSGMCFDSKRGQVLTWGGGHYSYPGNEVQAYRVAENRWVSLGERSVIPMPVRWATPAPGTDPMGRPFAWHSYDDLEYDPVGDQMIWMAAGGASGVWFFSLADHTWTCRQPSPRPGGGLEACSAYVPQGRLVAVAGPGDDMLWFYDIAADKFTQAGKLPTRPYGCGMTYDTANRLLVMAGGKLPDTWIYSMDKKEWRKGEPENAPGPVHACGLTFDSVNNVVILAGAVGQDKQRVNRTWILDAKTGRWTDPQPLAQPTIELAGIYSSLQFDPTANLAIVTWGSGWRGKCETWVYRYRAAKPAKEQP